MTEYQKNFYRTISAAGIGLLLCVGATSCRKQDVTTGEQPTAIPVRVEAARNMMFVREIHLQGSLESERFALVPAEASGTIKQLLAKEGDIVKVGQPLCELDSETLQRMLNSQEQELAVAGNGLAVAQAQEAQAFATHTLAQKDHARYKSLAEDKVISVQQMDQAERAAVAAASTLDVASAQVELARARVKQAETSVAIARSSLGDATVCAPINGIISIRHREQGEMVHNGDPVFRIDDPSVLEASVFLPAHAYGDVIPGRTIARIRMGDVDLGQHPVSYRSPTVDERLRTFEIKARITNPPSQVVAGGLADVRIVLDEHEGIGIPVNAILTRDDKTVTFLNRNGRARQTEIQTRLRTEGYLEIIAGISKDDSVIVQGQQFVNDGDAVTVVED